MKKLLLLALLVVGCEDIISKEIGECVVHNINSNTFHCHSDWSKDECTEFGQSELDFVQTEWIVNKTCNEFCSQQNLSYEDCIAE